MTEDPFTTSSGADEADARLSAGERQLLAGVDSAIAGAVELESWWREVDAAGAYPERFDLSVHGRSTRGFGFFGEAEIGGANLPIMGCVQEQLFDRPKRIGASRSDRDRAAEWIDRQIRELTLRYFLRICDFQQPEAFPGSNGHSPPAYLRSFGWATHERDGGASAGFEQVFGKLKATGEIRRFSGSDRHAIVDLREVGRTWEWIVLKVEILSFKLVLAPFGQRYPHGTVPASEPSYLVISEDLVADQAEPEPEPEGDRGRYGYGAAFLPAADESLLASGLGRFTAALHALRFQVKNSGEVVARTVFVANRPSEVVQLSPDPVDWGFRMADRMSFGSASALLEPMQKMWHRMPAGFGLELMQAFVSAANRMTDSGAARSLGISRKQLHKSFLVAQLTQHHNAVAGTLAAWRQISDWTDRENLPDWVTGILDLESDREKEGST